jgi:hypothetical protein
MKDDIVELVSMSFLTILNVITTLIAAYSLILSKRSFEQTEKTLKLTENEQELRDIEKSLALFYFPLQDYIQIYLEEKEVIRKSMNIKDVDIEILQKELDKRNEKFKEMFKNVAPYRYLAEENTRREYEKLRILDYIFPNPYETSLLVDSLGKDVASKEIRRRELVKNINEVSKE